MAERRKKRGSKAGDGLENDFGPGFDPTPEAPKGATGARPASKTADFAAGFAGIPCGKDGCILKPVGDLVTRFAFELARRGHADSASRATTSGIELLRALRDFLDEEIAFAERAAEKQRGSARYTKIPVD
ncbi:MAG: hypothetical protein IPN03_06895 [Holophagales bacterium]|nr:hypothetical protein [Holophagales bacterium]